MCQRHILFRLVSGQTGQRVWRLLCAFVGNQHEGRSGRHWRCAIRQARCRVTVLLLLKWLNGIFQEVGDVFSSKLSRFFADCILSIVDIFLRRFLFCLVATNKQFAATVSLMLHKEQERDSVFDFVTRNALWRSCSFLSAQSVGARAKCSSLCRCSCKGLWQKRLSQAVVF